MRRLQACVPRDAVLRHGGAAVWQDSHQMQMRFDGLLGFPGGLVEPSKETLEAGLTRELLEEVGVAVPVSVDDHVESRFAPPPSASSQSSQSSQSSRLILHFYVKKMEEEQIREVERAAASTAADHGLEVMGMVRVPLYATRRGGGLPLFLSHSFIGSARSQLLDSLLRLRLLPPADLQAALRGGRRMQAQSAQDLQRASEDLTRRSRESDGEEL